MKGSFKKSLIFFLTLTFILCLVNPAYAASDSHSLHMNGNAMPLNSAPTLTWNTFLGSGVASITADDNGNVYVTGNTQATWGSPLQAYSGGYDIFVAKLDASGNLLWNTFLGHSGFDGGDAITVDSNGNVFVTGRSNGTWGSPLQAYSGSGDAFVAKLDTDGALKWNTFVGGSESDYGISIAVDGTGNIYLGGYSDATWGSPVRAFTASYEDAFAAKLNSSGALTWNTFLGGSGAEEARSIAVDGSGNVYMAGFSSATWGSPVRAYSADNDAFIAKMDSSGTLTWNTFLGQNLYDEGKSIAVDGSGSVYVTGYSKDTWGSPIRAFTVTPPNPPFPDDSADAFVAKLDSSGAVTWNTFLGGAEYDYGYSITFDNGDIYVAGTSGATWGSPARAYDSNGDTFSTKLDSSGGLTWNTFLGGVGADNGSTGFARNGKVYVAGWSTSTWGSPVQAFSPDVYGLGGFIAVVTASDTTPAVGSIDSHPAALTSSTSANFTFSATDNITIAPNFTFWCLLDSGSWELCNSGSKSYTGLSLGEHTFTLDVLDEAGNSLYPNYLEYTWTVDAVPSVVFINRADASPTSSASVNFTVTFSEAITGVDTADFALTTTGVSGAAVSGVNGSGTTYTVSVNTGSGNGSIRLDLIDNDSIQDANHFPLGSSFTAGQLYSIIKTVTFEDVPATHWASSFIERLSIFSITGGCSTTPLNFCPDQSVTRAQMAVFLLKGLHGSSYAPPAVGTSTGFTDVPTSYWAAAWIKQLAAESITGGCGNGNYCPDSTVTRAQMAVFLLKATHGTSYTPPAVGSGTGFTDVPSDYWAAAWIKQLAAEGITGGCGTGIYCPDSSVTRAQMAIFLVKAFSLP